MGTISKRKKVKALKIPEGEHRGCKLKVETTKEGFVISDCGSAINFDELIWGCPENAKAVGEWLIEVAKRHTP